MNELRNFVLTVATAGILVAVIDALAPEGKRGRGVKFVSSLFMILMVLSPLAKLLGSFDPGFALETKEAFETEEAAAFAQRSILTEVEEKTAERAKELIWAECGAEAEIHEVTAEKDEMGNILIKRIVYSSSGMKEQIERTLRENFGQTEVVEKSGA